MRTREEQAGAEAPPLDAAEPCERLAWDSRFFGVETARAHGDALTPDRVRQIDDWCRQRKIAWLYFLARADDAQTTRCAEDAGFRLVDVRVTYERSLAGYVPSAAVTSVRPYAASDLPALKDIARSSYTDSRFYYDGRIPREKCDELFETWTTLSCQGRAQQVLVAHDQERPIGYVTCDIDRPSGWGSIGLIGVDASARGKRVGGRLVESALAWAAGQGLAGVTVVTQGRNMAAQRLYQRCGFITRSLQLYYHKWYE